MRKIILLFISVFLILSESESQVRKVPDEVKSAFEKQYPGAQQVDYKDILKGFTVHFVLDSVKMTARYNNKGEWKETEKQSDYYALPAEVKDGYMKSKYADGEWEVKESQVIFLPGEIIQYRIRVDKSDLQKKYLYFDQYGRLLKDPITI